MPVYENFICIIYRTSSPITWFTLMNLTVIKGLGSGRQAVHHLAWPRCKCHILPAYAQDGVVLSRVFRGSTDTTMFEDFMAQLLQHCGRWPEPKSVLVMNNITFHHSVRIVPMCADAGLKLVYLPPYSPDLNPIEEFFAELKIFIKRNWSYYETDPNQGFDVFLTWCIDVVGARKESARGHFRHAGLEIEEVS